MHALPALLLHIVREAIASHDQNFADWQCRIPACNRNRTVMNPECTTLHQRHIYEFCSLKHKAESGIIANCDAGDKGSLTEARTRTPSYIAGQANYCSTI